uniref:Uncharacterized protein n=1 Tax=Arundo donax TaxID=35708 RepID=A0A0A9BX60_ARUDO
MKSINWWIKEHADFQT